MQIQSSYIDADGVQQKTSPDDLRAIEDCLPKRAPRGSPVEPVSVAWAEELELIVSVPRDAARGTIVVEIPSAHVAVRERLQDLPARRERDGVLDLVVTARVPLGRHEARIELLDEVYHAVVISAPTTTWSPPEAEPKLGVFAPIYALKSERSLGVGDLSDLDALSRGLRRAGANFVGTLPLLAMFDDGEVFSPSPYSPASRLFFAERHLDLRKTPEFVRSRNAKARLSENERELRALLDAPFVDHRAVARARRSILEAVAATYFGGRTPAPDDEHLAPYAKHRAMSEVHGAWPTWPAGARLPRATDSARRLHHYAQVRLLDQLRAQTELYVDLPVGVSGDSYDVWTKPELFLRGLSVGAPPDALAVQGQNWGFPPIDPVASRAEGHAYLFEVIRRHCAIASILRIDHVMGLHRLWVMPSSQSAAHGAYLSYPFEELWAMVCLLSHQHSCVVVGEDLGTVPGTVRQAMTRHRARRMYIGQFGLDDDAELREPPRRAIASFNSHDTPSFAGWWAASDVDLGEKLEHISIEQAKNERERRRALTGKLAARFGDMQGAHDGLASALASSDAELLQVQLEDTWGETRPQNVPGTFLEVPNFAGRMRFDVDQSVERAAPLIARLAAARRGIAPATKGEWLSDDDRYFFAEGTHRRAHDKLGAHCVEGGAHFHVWAPNAVEVEVVGDFNAWRGERMSPSAAGIWSLFRRDARAGQNYKFRVTGERGDVVDKADPFARRTEVPPKTASVLAAPLAFEWRDEAWCRARAARQDLGQPISIYEVHLGSWARADDGTFLSYREIATPLADYARNLGFTHVELMPVAEHPFYGSWGYQVVSHFAPSARYGSPEDFCALVDELHRAGLGVIVDWVPAHFPSDAHGLARFDGSALFEHADPRLGEHPDWGTKIFNYGRHEVESFLLSSALYWFDQFHVDGLRVDAVASMLYRDYSRKDGEWIPNRYGGRENLEAIALLQAVNDAVHDEHPGALMIAEESTAWPGVTRATDQGGLGFDLKWDMGWMNDTLAYMREDPVHRRHHHQKLTFRNVYAHAERFCLALSHDEVVHGKGALVTKMPGDDWQKRANVRLLLGYQWLLPGKQLVFMGMERGVEREWSHERSLEEEPTDRGVMTLVARLNGLLKEQLALSQKDHDPAGFRWLHDDGDNSVISFVRESDDPRYAVFVYCNFTPVVHEQYPTRADGPLVEVLSTDHQIFGGAHVVNTSEVREHLRLGALSMHVLVRVR